VHCITWPHPAPAAPPGRHRAHAQVNGQVTKTWVIVEYILLASDLPWASGPSPSTCCATWTTGAHAQVNGQVTKMRVIWKPKISFASFKFDLGQRALTQRLLRHLDDTEKKAQVNGQVTTTQGTAGKRDRHGPTTGYLTTVACHPTAEPNQQGPGDRTQCGQPWCWLSPKATILTSATAANPPPNQPLGPTNPLPNHCQTHLCQL
jgi:hypothetical protein